MRCLQSKLTNKCLAVYQDAGWLYINGAWLPAVTVCNLKLYKQIACVPILPIVVTTSTIPNTFTGSVYNQQLTATGGYGPLTFSASGLPSGLSMSESGLITGIATTAGQSTVHVAVEDAVGNTAFADYPMTVTEKIILDNFTDANGTLITNHYPTPVNTTGGKWALTVPVFFSNDPTIESNTLVVPEQVLYGQVSTGTFPGAMTITASFQFTEPGNAYTYRLWNGVPYFISGPPYNGGQATIASGVFLAVSNAQSDLTPNTIELYQVIDTSGTNHYLASVPWTADFNQHTLVFKINGTSLSGYLDGSLVISATCDAGLTGPITGVLMDVWTTTYSFEVTTP
jgi:hypothetical protein